MNVKRATSNVQLSSSFARPLRRTRRRPGLVRLRQGFRLRHSYDATSRRDGLARRVAVSVFAEPSTRRIPGRNAKEMCHSTKRTHRFFDGKVGLSDWGTMGSDGRNPGISVGSFWKTNPPGGGLLRCCDGFWFVFGCFVGCSERHVRARGLQRREFI